ncbi:MAG TPA: metallophosphoesterase [Bryobacteraceae bacterium]|jgi:predicted phosphodiesterase|nr:metallophosphoesterase [Bryobacteraceae bacterium]
MRRLFAAILFSAAILAALAQTAAPPAFHFVILGDRTGEAQPGVWQQVWKKAAARNPAIVVGVGDTIQGLDDATADAEWRDAERTLAPYRAIPLYLAPGNHDIWSAESEKLFEKYTGHPPHYSFDFGNAHFTILDNSRADDFSAAEMAFLAADLEKHQAKPLKFIVSHRPSWLVNAALRNPNFELHRLARKYGVQYVIAGHVHQLLHVTFDGVTYFCAPSAGGHLRASGKYEDGWFFGYTDVTVTGTSVRFEIESLDGRRTSLADWGLLGLTVRPR